MAVPVALVTGSNSGVGRSLSLLLAKEGFRVYASMRDLSKGAGLLEEVASLGVADQIRPTLMDVADDKSVETAVQQVLAEAGRIDLLVNNAGYSLFGTLEMVTMEQVKAQFETNFFGSVRCAKAVLPAMRQQKSGKIAYLSSVGGVWGQAFNDVYCASKFAMEGMAESQAALFREFGVYVSLVEPGGIKSAFLDNGVRPDFASVAPEYSDAIKRVMAFYQKGSTAQTPEEVAQAIMDQVVKVESPPLRVQTNPLTLPIFDMKLADRTGEKAVALNRDRLLAPVEPAPSQP